MKNKFIITIVVVMVAMAVGLYYEYFSTTVDGPVEQFAERVLKDNGIDVDFSKNKKNR